MREAVPILRPNGGWLIRSVVFNQVPAYLKSSTNPYKRETGTVGMQRVKLTMFWRRQLCSQMPEQGRPGLVVSRPLETIMGLLVVNGKRREGGGWTARRTRRVCKCVERQ